MIKFLPGLLLLLISTTVFSQHGPDHRKLGDLYLKSGQFAQARNYYTQAIDSDAFPVDTLAKVYYSRATCYERLKDLDNALTDYDFAIKYNKKYLEAYCDRANVFSIKNNNSLALNDYNTCLSIVPSKRDDRLKFVYNGMAVVYFKLHEIDSALKYNAYAIQEDVHWSNSFYTRGMILQSVKQYLESINYFDHAIANTNNTELLRNCYLQRGNSKNLNKHSKDAIKDFESVIDLDPDNKEANWNRAYCYYSIQDYKTAAKYYTQILPLFQGDDKRTADLYFWRGECEMQQFQYTDAIKDDSVSVSLNPDKELVYTKLATAYAGTGNFDMAIAKYRIALTFQANSNIENSILYTNIGEYQYKQNNDMEAITSFNKALNLNVNNFYGYFCRGLVYLKHLKSNDQAMYDFNKVIALDTSRRSHDYIFSLFYTGKQNEAIEILQHQLAKANNFVTKRNLEYSLASIYALMNDANNANSELKMAIDQGYAVNEVVTDENFNSIRNSKGYMLITAANK